MFIEGVNKLRYPKNRCINILSGFFLFILLISPICPAGMVNPDIDKPDEPFSYFSFPTDVIGFKDSTEGTEITPEGYLYTGYGELIFYYGDIPVAVNQRVKTYYKGNLPIIQYKFEDQGVRYSVTAFAHTVDGTPEAELINFIRVQFENLTQDPRAVFWTVGTRYTGQIGTPWAWSDYRFPRPIKPAKVGQFEQRGEVFSRDWKYGFEDGMMIRDGKVFYLFPMDVPSTKLITLKTGYSDHYWENTQLLPTTPVGLVKFKLKLEPRQKKSFDLKMPYRPLPVADAVLDAVKKAEFDDYFDRTVKFWENIFADGMQISVPEEKVINTFKTSLVYDLIARDKIGDDFVQKVNEFHYDAFWLRDSAYIVRGYDVTGYHKTAEQCLAFFLKWQNESGNFVSHTGEYDGFGQSLWAIGQHYLITGDKDFARRYFPAVEKAMNWLTEERKKDPLHIMPSVHDLKDNELIQGHVTGHNFWALGGIKHAIAMAQGLGETEKAEQFKRQYDDYMEHFKLALNAAAQKAGGYIPPGLDGQGGHDWGNMMAVYPIQTLDPCDPLVTKTLQVMRGKYKEGLMTFNGLLHHYLTMKNTETEVIRGGQQQVLDEFYSILLHTSSTHAGFEFAITPWGDRDFHWNLTPHGWFAAKFRTLLRNMLVREQGNELHLFSVISPTWVKQGEKISVKKAPTNFGTIDFSLEFEKDSAKLKLRSEFRKQPDKIILHIPWFANIEQVKADGRKIEPKDGVIVLEPDTKDVTIDGRIEPIDTLNYEYYVEKYKEQYRKKYEEFLKNGN